MTKLGSLRERLDKCPENSYKYATHFMAAIV